MKQAIGSWKFDIAKDTIALWDLKSYGTAFEGFYRIVTKGKIVMEAKQLWGYDKKFDKYIGCQVTKGMDIELSVAWFRSNNKFEFILYSDINDPDKASFKVEGDFKSKDMLVETYIVDGKPFKVDTWTRVKQ